MPSRDLVNVNTSAPEDHAAQARRYQDRATDAQQKIAHMARSIGGTFGEAVYLVLDRRIEEVTENTGEALYHYEQAVAEKQREIDAMRSHTARSQQTLVYCAERILAKYGKVRRPLPDDLSQVVCMAAVTTGWGYLFPPTHESHAHDFDAAGACRNPMCKHTSDDDEGPF